MTTRRAMGGENENTLKLTNSNIFIIIPIIYKVVFMIQKDGERNKMGNGRNASIVLSEFLSNQYRKKAELKIIKL